MGQIGDPWGPTIVGAFLGGAREAEGQGPGT